MKNGFTLIELSIVLVIVGLLIKGILQGKELIQSSRNSSTVKQIETYKSAVNAFRGKYNYLPGDIRNASRFGFYTRSGANAHGNGDGIIAGCVQSHRLGCETSLFWRDLSDAKLINGNYSGATDTAAISVSDLSNYLPEAKLEEGNMFAVYPGNGGLYGTFGYNYLYLGRITSTESHSDYIAENSITPAQAYSIDKKIDDGQPQTGIVDNVTTNNGIRLDQNYSTGNCATSSISYNLGSNSSLCQLSILLI